MTADEASNEARAGALLSRHAQRHRGLDVRAWSSIGAAARVALITELARKVHFEPELGEEVGALHTEIRRRRSLGEVWFGVWGRPESEHWAPREVADRATSALGLGILGASWRDLSRSDAHALLALGLREDMAYDTQLMTDEDARALADRFAALFPKDAQFFTNSLWTEGKIAGWYEAVASSTFETGVVVVSRTRAGVLWFGDED